MSINLAASAVADYTKSLGLSLVDDNRPFYNHMGAILTDSVLQAGLNYTHVVYPRVRYVLETFPSAKTTLGFLEILNTHGAANVLQWQNPIKPMRLGAITQFLVDNCVYTANAFGQWLQLTSNVETLLLLPGIGPKTASYIRLLTGLDDIPIDRHVRTFVQAAGVSYSKYADIENILKLSAEMLGVSCRTFDRTIWQFESSKKRRESIY